MKPLKRGEIKRAWSTKPSLEQWKAAPDYKHDAGFIIDKRFGIVRHEYLNAWILTHLPTGFSASHYIKTKEAAVRAVRALYKTYRAPLWDFTDPDVAVSFTQARAILKPFEISY